jgi:hypothetical protein
VADHVLIGDADYQRQATGEVPYVWAGVVQYEHLVLLAGPSGVGKTTLATHLVVGLANPTGKPIEVLGRAVTPLPADQVVLLIEEENGPRSIARKLEEACLAYGLPVAETRDRIVTIARGGVRIGGHGTKDDQDRKILGDVLAWIDDGLIGAMFVDSWAAVVAGDPVDEREQARAAAWLRKLVGLMGGPLFVIVHTRKSGAATLEDVAGSHQRAAAADGVLLATAEREDGQVLSTKVEFAKLRDFDGDEYPSPVSFSIAKGPDGAPRVALNASARASDQPAHERVFDLLRAGGQLTKRAIRDELGLSGERLEKALTVLFADKRLRKSSEVVAGRRRDVFVARLTDEEAGIPVVRHNAAAEPPKRLRKRSEAGKDGGPK